VTSNKKYKDKLWICFTYFWGESLREKERRIRKVNLWVPYYDQKEFLYRKKMKITFFVFIIVKLFFLYQGFFKIKWIPLLCRVYFDPDLERDYWVYVCKVRILRGKVKQNKKKGLERLYWVFICEVKILRERGIT
jgi:hypothetical protein